MTDRERLIEYLQDLHQRLVLNYNDGVPFEQFEEDRLAVINAIDLIDCQKAEIEALKIANEKMYSAGKEQEAEIERLEKENDETFDSYQQAVWMRDKQIAEAIKEFAERLEPLKKFRSCMSTSEYELSVTMRDIDNLVKEMVGDAE